ncbi:MAG: hypothetical protein GF392_06120 [Candidatus Omnitrophica bacterium]|nr:hypothetical protein [Candidatus Omnitrophota bacterium]
MVFLTKLISIAIIIYGCMLVLRPEMLKDVLDFIRKGNRAYVASTVKAVLGGVMILAAPDCRVPWVILFFGSLSLLLGAVMFLFKKAVIKSFIRWWEQRTPGELNLAGIAVLALGIILILAV